MVARSLSIVALLVVLAPSCALVDALSGSDDISNPGDGDGDGDGDTDAGFPCNDDSSIEPNDTTATATETSIPDIGTTFALTSLAICPSSDRDVFRLRIDANGKMIDVNVLFEDETAPLDLVVFSDDAGSMDVGTSDGPGQISVRVATPGPGFYFVEISSGFGLPNNYDIFIDTFLSTP